MRGCIIQVCTLYILFFLSFFFFLTKKISGDFTYNPKKGRYTCLTPFLRAPLGVVFTPVSHNIYTYTYVCVCEKNYN